MGGAVEVMGAERGLLMFYQGCWKGMSRRGEGARPGAEGGPQPEKEEWESERFSGSRSVIAQVESGGQGRVVTDAQSEQELREQPSVSSQHLRSIICLPIKIKDAMIGVMSGQPAGGWVVLRG